MPPGSIHPERAEFMALHGGVPTMGASSDNDRGDDNVSRRGTGESRRGTGESVTSAARRMSRSDSVKGNRYSRASVLLDHSRMSMFDPAPPQSRPAGVQLRTPSASDAPTRAGAMGAKARLSTGSADSRLSLLCEGKSSIEHHPRGPTPEGHDDEMVEMLEQLAVVRRASATVDAKLARLSATASVVELKDAPGAIAEEAVDVSSSPESSAEAELEALRAELAAVREHSATMEAAIAKQPVARITAPAPPTPTSPPNASLLTRKPSRPAPAPPSASSASTVHSGSSSMRHPSTPDEDYGVLSLLDLDARFVSPPRSILRPAVEVDPLQSFPPTVWLDCFLEAHAVMVANEVWGFDDANTSESSDDLIGLAMSAGAVC
jgi:hypothetical protein